MYNRELIFDLQTKNNRQNPQKHIANNVAQIMMISLDDNRSKGFECCSHCPGNWDNMSKIRCKPKSSLNAYN